jgi:RNA polymerase sigma factor (sigma-70 family)
MSDGSMGAVVHYLRDLVRPGAEAEPTDAQLLERFIAGREEQAFANLMMRHGPMVQGVCRRLLQHVQDAEDVFQATFLVLARKAGSVRKRASLASWLYGVAYRLARKALVAAARRRARERKAPAMANPDFSTEMSRRELRSVLDEEINRLPEKWRGPFILYYLEGKSQEEAASLFGLPAGSISFHLARARERLRGRLSKRGVALAAGGLTLGATELSPAVAVSLVARTVQAALLIAGGKTAPATLVSAEGLALAQTMARTTLANPKVIVAALLVFAAVGAAAALLVRPLFAPQARTTQTAERPRPRINLPVKLPEKKQPPRLWRERHTWTVSRGSVRGLALAPGAKYLATLGSPRQEIGKLPEIQELLEETHPKLWNTANGKKLQVFSAERPMDQISSLAFAPDGKTLATAEMGVVLWDVTTGNVKATFPEPTSVAQVVFSPDGRTLALARADGVLRFADLGKGVLTTLPKSVPPPATMTFTPDSKRLITAAFDGQVQVWEVAGRTLRSTRQVGKDVAPRVLSADGKTLAASVFAVGDPSVEIWDVATGKLRATLTPRDEQGWTNALAFAPDGKRLAAGSSEGAVLLWDRPARKEPVRLSGLKGRVTALVFAPDNQFLAGGDSQGTVKVWQLGGPARTP